MNKKYIYKFTYFVLALTINKRIYMTYLFYIYNSQF